MFSKNAMRMVTNAIRTGARTVASSSTRVVVRGGVAVVVSAAAVCSLAGTAYLADSKSAPAAPADTAAPPSVPAQSEVSLSKEEWKKVQDQLLRFFRKHKDVHKAAMSKKELQKVLSTVEHGDTATVKSIFEQMDVNQDGAIEFWEAVSCTSFLSGMDDTDKMGFLFKVCDSDGDGRITKSELDSFLRYMFKVKAKLLGHKFMTTLFHPDDIMSVKFQHMSGAEAADTMAHDTVRRIFEVADADKDGTLSLEEFQKWMYFSKTEFGGAHQDVLTRILAKPTADQLRAAKDARKGQGKASGDAAAADKNKKEKKKKSPYDTELERLMDELVHFQYWAQANGKKVLVIFEGRDAAGKGGAINAMTQALNQRGVRIVALGKPTDVERTQWYFQRYLKHMPSAGEITIFDRSWYNRSGVERVMGFCTPAQLQQFFVHAPQVERMLVESGITIVKYWLSVSPEEEDKRLHERNNNPVKRWKLSPMDLESRAKWMEYSRAKDEMLLHTDKEPSPWYQVPSDDKKAARLNIITHFLSLFPEYKDWKLPDPVALDERGPIVEPPRPGRNVDRIIPQLYGRGGRKKTREEFKRDEDALAKLEEERQKRYEKEEKAKKK